MKLTFVNYGSINALTGGHVYDRYLLRYLKKRGDQVRIVSLSDGGFARHLTDNFRRSLIETLLVDNPDLILQDEICHPSLVLVNRLLERGGAPPVVSLVHHLTTDEFSGYYPYYLHKYTERLYFAGIQGVLANTHVTLNRVQEVSRIDLPSAVALPGAILPGPPLDRSALDDRLNLKRPLHILFVGNLIERKLVTVLLNSVADVSRKTDIRLTIVGGGELEPRYAKRVRRIAKPLVERGIVRFVGPKRGYELANLYSEADLLAVPSGYEGFGIVYLEGMAYGLPAIGTAAGGAREIIANGVNGYLVHPHDTSHLSECLSRLANDRNLLARMSHAARDSYDAHPSWDESMNQAYEFLHRMARQHT